MTFLVKNFRPTHTHFQNNISKNQNIINIFKAFV